MLNEEKRKYDVIIVGAGPAGMSAAIYLKRAGINVAIFEKEAPGGTLNKTYIIENYPGYVDKDGTTLAFKMYSQIMDLSIDLQMERIINIEKDGELFKVTTSKSEYFSDYIIISSGREPKKLEVPGVQKNLGKGISYCAFCDGALYKNKDIIVVGGGNSAMQAVRYMRNIANKIYLVIRSSVIKADEKELDILDAENIEIYYNSEISEVIFDEFNVTGVKLKSNQLINAAAIFVCIGQKLNSSFYQKLNLKMDESGIIVDNNMETSLERVYACGDAISKNLYQVVTAVSEGAIASTNIINQIKKKCN